MGQIKTASISSLPFGATEESSLRRYRRRLDLSRVFAGGIRPSEIRRIESRQEKRHLVILVPLRQLVQRVAQRLLRRQGRMREIDGPSFARFDSFGDASTSSVEFSRQV